MVKLRLGYLNLVDQLKLSLNTLSVSTPNAASQYFFCEYFESLSAPMLVDPTERGSRNRPSVELDAVQRRTEQLHNRMESHEDFIVQLAASADSY